MAKKRPSLGTRILNDLAVAVLPRFLESYIDTCRLRIVGRDVRKGLGPHIAAAMHGDFPPLAIHFGRENYVAMISRSRDGDLGSRVAIKFGFRVVRGSSSSGGKEALQALVERGLRGESPAIVTDGPRGPAGISKPGAVVLARRTGLPIVIVAVEAKRAWRLGNWDRTLVPCPFTRIAFRMHGPVYVPPDADWEECEQHRRELDKIFVRMREELRAYLRR